MDSHAFLHVSNQHYSIATRHYTRVICEIQTSVFRQNLRDLEHIYYSSRAPPCTTFQLALLVQHFSAHSLSLKTHFRHYPRCLPVLPLLLYLLLLSLPAASAAAFVQACCWFLTAQQIRFARQCSSVLTAMHLIPASSAKRSLSSFLGAAPNKQHARDSPTYEASTMRQGWRGQEMVD